MTSYIEYNISITVATSFPTQPGFRCMFQCSEDAWIERMRSVLLPVAVNAVHEKLTGKATILLAITTLSYLWACVKMPKSISMVELAACSSCIRLAQS